MSTQQIIERIEARLAEVFSLPVDQVVSDRPRALRLAEKVGRLFDDAVLTEAAYLHALDAEQRAKVGPTLNPDIPVILDTWRMLRRRDPEDASDRGASAEILAGLRDPRAAALLAVECLDRWDPSGELHEWSKAYRTVPDVAPFQDRVASPEYAPLDGVSKGETPVPHLRELAHKKALMHLADVAAAAAEHCGLWNHRNTLENIAYLGLYPTDMREVITRAKQCSGDESECRTLANLIDEVLPEQGREPAQWQWRHPASVVRQQYALKNPAAGGVGLWRVGYVMVVCDDAPTCYRMLGILHCFEGVRCETDHFRDYIGNPTNAGYRSLHTRVHIEHSTDARRTIPVRFAPRVAERGKPWRDRLKHLLLGNRNTAGRIRVYTPEGAFRDLSEGSTVLEFASAIHGDFVTRLDHAIINEGRRAGALDRLADQDHVELIVRRDGAPRMPPEGWKAAVQSPHRIRNCLVKTFRAILEDAGRDYLRRINGLDREYASDDVFNAVINLAIDDTRQYLGIEGRTRRVFNTTPQWWLWRIGLRHHGKIEGVSDDELSSLFKAGLDDRIERTFLESVNHWLEKLTPRKDALDIAPGDRARTTKIQMCKRCDVDQRSDTLIATRDGSVITLHEAGAECAKGGTEVRRSIRFSVQQYFVIETIDRPGIVGAMLAVFYHHRVAISEIMARRAGPKWSVVRIEVDFVPGSLARSIERELGLIPDVQRVLGPNHPPSQFLEHGLPPRIANRNDFLAPLSTPYVCGDVVRLDEHFYNRTTEIADLHEQFLVQSGAPNSGASSFVSGPLKTGKTSLVEKFIRDLRRENEEQAVVVYLKAKVDRPWGAFASEISRQLRNRLKEHSARFIEPLYGKERAPSATSELVQSLDAAADISSLLAVPFPRHYSPVIVIVVDEALRLFRHAHERAMRAGARDEIHAIESFVDTVHNRPKCQLVWVGPAAPVKWLDPELQQVLRSAQQIDVKPFSASHCARMLRASNLSWRYSIEIKKVVLERIAAETGGNPYWINHLGSKMWRRAMEMTPGLRLVYTNRHFTEARAELLSDDSLFIDRVLPNDSSEGMPRWWEPLVLLVARRMKEFPGEPYIEPEFLSVRLRQEFGLDVDVDDLVRGLDDLGAMGGVSRTGQSFAMSSRLLADWVLLAPRFEAVRRTLEI